MRELKDGWFDSHRDRVGSVKYYGWEGDETCGVFRFPSPTNGRWLLVIASTGQGWDHVSVSSERHIPTWKEMEIVARIFFKEDEIAFQLHVPEQDHINIHPNTLHWWRPTNREIPLPSKALV